MKKSGGPIREFPLAEKALRDFKQHESTRPLPDFTDTELTFSHLSDDELKRTRMLFRLMAKPWLTSLMGTLGIRAVNWHLPGAGWMVENTIYHQFVGGTSLVSSLDNIERLAARGVTSILDYGAEAKEEREEMDKAMKEILKAIDMSSSTDAAIGAVVKLSSIFPYESLERYNEQEIDFQKETPQHLKNGLKRLDAICNKAAKRGCIVFLDAEESWIQGTIDHLAELMMSRYNQTAHIVYTTCQLYRTDRLAYLKAAHLRAKEGDYKLGVKIVRGAYMNKERDRAEDKGYPSPIQPNLKSTHRDFNAALTYCLENIDSIACCIASHNQESIELATRLMQEKAIPRSHPNVLFSQLLGMSDNVTFNLAEGGYNVSKYMVYGPVIEVLPYLVRRAQENTSVTGEAGRELTLLNEEVNRRARKG